MSSLKYQRYRSQRYFYVSAYRKIIKLMFYSVSFNVFLFTLGSYIFFNEQAPEYFGTNGATNPVELSAINAPNYSSSPLLPDDIPGDDKPVTQL
jgi:intracellular multiplication protein IcmM